ncbi:hypothetical protein [Egicoccus sp. AB-alg6-2]|uniref:DUF6929 family protein n=1 Tax=Egicoccus sp. AB-alg6-2 TaxID=3242692 RepID=UPI00359E8AE6
MTVEVSGETRLWFGPHDPVRAASGVAAFGDGWLVAQDDANHAAWWRPTRGTIERIRLFPSRDGRDLFDEESGTKRWKPDLETACDVATDAGRAVLLLGSGSLAPRMRAALVRPIDVGVDVQTADLTPLYARVRDVLELREADLNLEGACVVGDRLRWFQRGHGRTGVDSASVDVSLPALLAAVEGRLDPGQVEVGARRRYTLGTMAGITLAITDAVALHDGRICVSVTAEDTVDAVADGPVTGSALALVGDEDEPPVVLRLPPAAARAKVEGITVVGAGPGGVRLLAVVDDDDPASASRAFQLKVPVT